MGKIETIKESYQSARWPVYDEKALKRDKIEIVIQVNGKHEIKFLLPHQ